jgi:hypothetical protein
MFYLALISPLAVLGFLLVMQLFEAWVLGDPTRPGPPEPDAGRGPAAKDTWAANDVPSHAAYTRHDAKSGPISAFSAQNRVMPRP